uniref:Immunoglobulin V-set domain-containing protein n=1 Tax=Sus scrofa TaxID=9823 RepID=A0A8D0VAA7_PIG
MSPVSKPLNISEATCFSTGEDLIYPERPGQDYGLPASPSLLPAPLDLWMLWIYLFCFPSSASTSAETTVTQSPAFVSATPGDKVNITRKASQDIDDDIMCYQQKPGEAPKLLIKYASIHITGVPTRFSGSGYGTDFTLTIGNMISEDATYYFCQQDDNVPLTVISSPTKTSKCPKWGDLSCYLKYSICGTR